MHPLVYLASQSPRRRELLAQLGLSPEALLPDADEDAEALEALRGQEAPLTYVQRVTRLKLEAALHRRRARGLPPAPVICADTTVAVGRQILGKPQDAAQAREMLTRLSGRAHQVLTAVAVGVDAGSRMAVSRSKVWFAPLTAAQIQAYAASAEPMGKAGAYAIQGRAAAFVVRINGSYSGIMGLPLHETALLLHDHGLDV